MICGANAPRQPPIMTFLDAIIAGFPRKTPHIAVSIDGIHRAAGRKSIMTDVEPTAIGVPNG